MASENKQWRHIKALREIEACKQSGDAFFERPQSLTNPSCLVTTLDELDSRQLNA